MTAGWQPAPMPPAPCPYCGGDARLHETSEAFYRGRDFGPVWACDSCGAYVGCHPGTHKPLGRLADKELRQAKMAVHDHIDQLWRRKMALDRIPKKRARGKAYKWLAGELGIDRKHCHVGMFDVEMCRRAVAICAPYVRRVRQ